MGSEKRKEVVKRQRKKKEKRKEGKRGRGERCKVKWKNKTPKQKVA